jgi:hypothetical protein
LAVKIVKNRALLNPDEAVEKIVPELINRICSQCALRRVCPLNDLENPNPESCIAITILERLFISAKISFKEATVAEDIPPADQKILYNLEGF